MRIAAILMGVVFLNLSFLLTELNAIDLKVENRSLYESLVSTFLNICEEEKDPLGGESENESPGKESFFVSYAFESTGAGFFLILVNSSGTTIPYPSDGASFSIHQPPEYRS